MRWSRGAWLGLLWALLLAGALRARVPRIFNERTKPWEPHAFRTYVTHRDMLYARHVSCRMDVHLPAEPLTDEARTAAAARRMPCILFIHGQGFAACNRDFVIGYREPVYYGFAMATISYRTVEEAVFPAHVHDCREAVRYLRNHARLLGIDPTRIGVWGMAAGGNLAAMVAVTGNVERFSDEAPAAPGSAAVAAAVAFYAPTDLTTIERQLWTLFRSDGPSFHPLHKMTRYEAYVDGPLGEKRDVLRAASPITHVDVADPPFLLYHGYSDPVVPRFQSIFFAEALKKAGVPVDLVIMPFAGHGFQSSDVALDRHHPKRRVLEFFRQRLGDGS